MHLGTLQVRLFRLFYYFDEVLYICFESVYPLRQLGPFLGVVVSLSSVSSSVSAKDHGIKLLPNQNCLFWLLQTGVYQTLHNRINNDGLYFVFRDLKGVSYLGVRNHPFTGTDASKGSERNRVSGDICVNSCTNVKTEATLDKYLTQSRSFGSCR